MRELKIALAVLVQEGKFHLQLRGDDPRIGGAGLVGCFGGKVEKDESPDQTVQRELREEVDISPAPTVFELVGQVVVTSDHQLEEVKVFAEVFRCNVANNARVATKEGKLVTWSLDEARANLDKMTTGTRACFEQLIMKEQ